MKVAIIMPAYNEEKRIGKTLEEYGKFFKDKKYRDFNFEIIVVINNTQDKTEAIVKSYAKKYRFIRYLNFKQGGKGFAIIEGFKEALKDEKNMLMGFVDADMATSPEAFDDLIEKIDNYDGIVASRYVYGAIVKPKQSISRIFVSRIFNFLIRVLFLMPYKDTQCGAKLFKKNAVESMIKEIGMTQWAFDIELLYLLKKHNFKVKESATIWADKEYSKINFMKAGPRMVSSVIRLRLINSFFEPLLKPFKFIAKIGDSLINKK